MPSNKFLGSILLIAGTSTGAAMLALPVSSAVYGLIPSISLFYFMLVMHVSNGITFIRSKLWLKPGSNIVSMLRKL